MDIGDTVQSLNDSNYSVEFSAETFVTEVMGPRYHSIEATVILLTLYGLVFISGTVGNVCTCIVIARNSNMQTATNYYLFSLAISDLFTLLIGKCLVYVRVYLVKC